MDDFPELSGQEKLILAFEVQCLKAGIRTDNMSSEVWKEGFRAWLRQIGVIKSDAEES